MSSLYVVATPIGNLEDISLRALRILRMVKLIAAEDTRKTRKLLTNYDIKTPLTSYHEHNKWSKLESLLHFIEAEGDLAVVSEAGMPGISDPGYELITAAGERGIPVVPIPGPSAVITAAAVSALPTQRITYLGFLPRVSRARKLVLNSVLDDPGTLVILEAPHRLQPMLKDVLSVLGDRRIAVCRELTKVHEEIYRGQISQAIERFSEPRGEFTLVIEGRQGTPEKSPQAGDIERRLRQLHRDGMSAKEAIPLISKDTGLARRELYRMWLKLV
jgi:16S rRNA (cytidine1402-2'-O)-methyltransferase